LLDEYQTIIPTLPKLQIICTIHQIPKVAMFWYLPCSGTVQ